MIIGGSDEKEVWAIGSMPSTLWVEGYVPVLTKSQLCLSFTPDQQDYPGGNFNYDRVNFTVVDVEILYCYPDILMYTGKHASSTPTQGCVANGYPQGGSYYWQYWTVDEGMLGIVSGQNTYSVDVKGVAPSHSVGDAKITVSYTFAGLTVEETGTVTVRRPKGTLHYAGNFGWQSRTWRNFFHPVYDQFAVRIDRIHIPCDEEVRLQYGPEPNTSPSPTEIWDAELDPACPYGNWPGGIAVLDVLGCPTAQTPNCLWDQDIYVGGWKTIPMYLLYVQPMEDDPWPCIWKEH